MTLTSLLWMTITFLGELDSCCFKNPWSSCLEFSLNNKVGLGRFRKITLRRATRHQDVPLLMQCPQFPPSSSPPFGFSWLAYIELWKALLQAVMFKWMTSLPKNGTNSNWALKRVTDMTGTLRRSMSVVILWPCGLRILKNCILFHQVHGFLEQCWDTEKQKF